MTGQRCRAELLAGLQDRSRAGEGQKLCDCCLGGGPWALGFSSSQRVQAGKSQDLNQPEPSILQGPYNFYIGFHIRNLQKTGSGWFRGDLKSSSSTKCKPSSLDAPGRRGAGSDLFDFWLCASAAYADCATLRSQPVSHLDLAVAFLSPTQNTLAILHKAEAESIVKLSNVPFSVWRTTPGLSTQFTN